MIVLLPILLTFALIFAQTPAEYKLLKKFRDTGDIKTGLFLLENYPSAVFKDELKLEVAKLLLDRGDADRARFVLVGINLNNVRDEYGKTASELWTALNLDKKELVLRFPEFAFKFIPEVELSEEERRRVYERLLSNKLYSEILKLSKDCLYRGIALFKLRRYAESAEELKNCEGDRAGVYALLSYLKTDDVKNAELFLKRRDSDILYYRYAWYLFAKGDYERARKFFLKSGFSFNSLFYAGLIDYIRGEYELAYEEFSEAERSAKGNIQRTRANFWKFKTLRKLGIEDLAEHYLKEASKGAGFYSVVARRLLGLPVSDRVEYDPPEGISPFGERLLGIYQLGFLHYMRLEAFNRIDEVLPEDIFSLLRVDPYLALKLAVRAFGANSDLYRSVAYPTPFRTLVEKVSDRFGVDKALVYAVMRQESLFDVKALSRSKAKGLMQLMDRTARWEADQLGMDYDDILEPGTNITLGTAYLRFLLDFWKGDLVRTVASYNAGQGVVKGWKRYGDDYLFIESIPYDETRRYVRRVLWFYYVYSEKLSEPSR